MVTLRNFGKKIFYNGVLLCFVRKTNAFEPIIDVMRQMENV